MNNLPPINSSIKQNLNLIELHVGFAAPFANPDHKIGEHEIYFNFHLTINNFEWYETIEYRFLYDLNTNIIPFGDDDAVLQTFPNLSADEYAAVYRMMSDRDFDEANTKLLQSHVKSMETWMYTVLSNLHKVDEESRQMCKQLFFRSEEKLIKYEHLLKLLKNKQLLEEQEQNPENAGLNKVFKAMTSLFSLPTTRSPSVLSERNLEKHVKLEANKAAKAATVEKDRVSVQEKETKDPNKRRSIFARSMGARSAKDKNEKVDSLAFQGHTALDVAKNTALLKVEVTRGNEAQQGVVMYDITLRMAGKKSAATAPTGGSNIYKVSQRFSAFKKLWLSLVDINNESLKPANQTNNASPYQDFIQLIKAPFPALPMKCYLGFSLNETELSQRTRMLDEWFRELCYNYKNMPASARSLIRQFLKFDMSRPLDIFFQDQLAWGTIEVSQKRTTPVIVLQQNILSSVPEEVMDEFETMSQADSASKAAISKKVLTNALPPPNKRLDVQETRTERSFRSNNGPNSELQNLIWETASQGGVSKKPLTEVKAIRQPINKR